ncbi:uncharacterized protein L201_007626 [Kwoniella dendrophila CBS 6074]|uniref:Uncharacterized protein n=1 Tax=Kwoniella dendrophila CBS 6074 TaxID=1295534 RepID=A0AAX4K721_9TREE
MENNSNFHASVQTRDDLSKLFEPHSQHLKAHPVRLANDFDDRSLFSKAWSYHVYKESKNPDQSEFQTERMKGIIDTNYTTLDREYCEAYIHVMFTHKSQDQRNKMRSIAEQDKSYYFTNINDIHSEPRPGSHQRASNKSSGNVIQTSSSSGFNAVEPTEEDTFAPNTQLKGHFDQRAERGDGVWRRKMAG